MAPVILISIYAASLAFLWKKVPFSEWRKPVYCFSALPVLLGMMFVNIWLVDTFLLDVIAALGTAREADQQLRASQVLVRRSELQEPMVALAISAPLAIVVSFAWFYLCLVLERRRRAAESTPSQNAL
ncbi:hypothetical protein [Pelomonas sp. KK5]|uniref:hypothetical protein n=1 Tax=Pelomonas sp. KK5 TaxID=1855730 RepID=UPI0011805ACA|nr:hypothetical protein [Pelomonas sp. KK5]